MNSKRSAAASNRAGAELLVLLRDTLKLDGQFSIRSGDFAIPAATDIVINGTGIGRYAPEARLAIDSNSPKPTRVVADVVFSPVRTRILLEAAARGCRVIDGLGMLFNPDAEALRNALEDALGV